MPLKVAILYNRDEGLARGTAADRVAAQAVLEAVAGVEKACRERGWHVRPIAAPEDPKAIADSLAAAAPSVVFNLVEALRGDSRQEALVAALLELTGIPYTGSPPRALMIGLEKPIAKELIAAHGIPVPAGRVAGSPDDLPEGEPFPFPWIVKPSREDASHGISTDSVVSDLRAARERVRHVVETYGQPALVEEFIAGRELNVSILGEGSGAFALSPGEIDFSDFPAGKPRLVTYEAKWIEDSPECRGTASVAARDLAPGLAERVTQIALASYRIVGLRDYGRVDLRLRPDGKPVVLEVNPNPDISPGAGLARAAARSGIDHGQLIERIVQWAVARCHSPASSGRSGP